MRYAFVGCALIGSVVFAAPSLAGQPQATFTLLDVASAYDVTVDQFGRTLVLVSDDCAGAGPVYIYLDDDWAVGFIDLTQLLGSWGPCN